MKQKLVSTLVFLACCIYVNAQDSKNITGTRAQSVYVELGGNGGFLSFNYATQFSKKNNGLGARAGIGFIPGFGFGFGVISTIFTFPLGLNYLVGLGPHYLEAGAGATISSGAIFTVAGGGRVTGIAFVPSIGYRYQPLRRGFTARDVASPLIGSGGATFWAGVSAGVRF
jgi:hypothetical protein